MPKVQGSDPEEGGVQPHDLLPVQVPILLDLQGALHEDAF